MADIGSCTLSYPMWTSTKTETTENVALTIQIKTEEGVQFIEEDE